MKQKSLLRLLAAGIAMLWMMTGVTNGYLMSGSEKILTHAAETEATEGSAVSEFLNSGYDATRAVIYDGTNEENYFTMNGRKYFQGIVLGDNNYQAGGSISYNVEEISSLSFVLCRVDNAGMNDITLTINCDDVKIQEVPMGSMETWKKVELDVSDYAVVTISYNIVMTKYGLAEFCVDGQMDEDTVEIPKPESNAAFINAAYDAYRIRTYDRTKPTESFRINGRTYHQGIVLGNNNYEQGGSVSFNVENVKTLRFTLGRIDNTGMYNIALSLYRDGVWWQDIEMDALTVRDEVELDVSDISVIRLYYDQPLAQYALANIEIDKFTEEPAAIPEYKTNVDFINSRYDSYRNESFDGSNEFGYFMMNGKKFYQGIVIGNNNYEQGGSFTFNVEKVKKLSFTVGRIDNTGMYDINLSVYRDGYWWQDISVGNQELWKNVELDVTKVSTLRFVMNQPITKYALANIIIDDLPLEMEETSPVYENGAEVIKARYDNYRDKAYDGSNAFNYFLMNEKEYYQGIVFGKNNYEQGGSFTFNVENADSFTFTLGKVDNTYSTNIELHIAKDGYEYYTLPVSADAGVKQYIIDTTDTSVLRFYFTQPLAQYAMANIALNGDYSKFSDGTYDFEQDVYMDLSKIISIDALAKLYNLGDVNLDGEVNALDASELLIAAALVGSGEESGLTDEQAKHADVNFDDSFNASDAAGILQFAAAKGAGYKGTSNEYFDEAMTKE